MTVRKIAISGIVIGERLRPIDTAYVDVLAADIQERGLLQPIVVRPIDNGYQLVLGALRLAACKELGYNEVQAIIRKQSVAAARMDEVADNITRKDLSALDRCLYLQAFKNAYEEEHPETRHGGDRKSEALVNKEENQGAIFAFWSAVKEAVKRTGLSKRSVELAIQIANGLSAATIERVRGTAIENRQTDLLALSQVESDIQQKALELLFNSSNDINSLTDALLAAQGLKYARGSDKSIDKICNAFVLLKKRERNQFFDLHQMDIEKWAAERGLKLDMAL